jgi:hypothetical protein
MTPMPPTFVPTQWSNQTLTLYHGSVATYQSDIFKGIDVTKGRTNADFGRGFYTTTALRQAHSWAWELSRRLSRKHTTPLPIVIAFEVDRDKLAALDTLCFVRGGFEADDFWSLVHHCRNHGSNHRRLINQGWYDVVVGPIAVSWRQRLTIHDADQISFHTPRAAAVLNQSNPRRVL